MITRDEAHGINGLTELLNKLEKERREIVAVVPEVSTSTTPMLTGFYMVYYRVWQMKDGELT